MDWEEYFPNSSRVGDYKDIPTFAIFSEKYLRRCDTADSKSLSTIQGYRKRLDGIWCLAFDDIIIDKLRRRDVLHVLVSREWESGKTFANGLTPLRGVFALAMEEVYIHTNPVESIKVSLWQKPIPNPLTR